MYRRHAVWYLHYAKAIVDIAGGMCIFCEYTGAICNAQGLRVDMVTYVAQQVIPREKIKRCECEMGIICNIHRYAMECLDITSIFI
jgi:hypothetical protein